MGKLKYFFTGKFRDEKTKSGKIMKVAQTETRDEAVCRECKKNPRHLGARCKECADKYRLQEINANKLKRKIEAAKVK